MLFADNIALCREDTRVLEGEEMLERKNRQRQSRRSIEAARGNSEEQEHFDYLGSGECAWTLRGRSKNENTFGMDELEEDLRCVVRHKALSKGEGKNIQKCYEARDEVRDRESGSDKFTQNG